MVVASGRQWLANASPPHAVSITPWFINMSDVGERKKHINYTIHSSIKTSEALHEDFSINLSLAHMDHTQREHDQPRSLPDGPNLTTASK